MAKVIWSDEAAARLELATDYIAQFNPFAASRLSRRLIESSLQLEDFPASGRPAGGSYRELVSVRPYVLRYRIDGDTVYIVGLRHSAQMPDD